MIVYNGSMIDIQELFPDISNEEFMKHHAESMRNVTTEIQHKLRGYNDFTPISLNLNPNISVKESIMRMASIQQLTDNQIIYLAPDDIEMDMYTEYVVTMINRYAFEKLYLKLSGIKDEEMSKNLPNLVYYDSISGKGFINGNYVYFKKSKPKSKLKAKEIFDLLFTYAPNSVPREKLRTTLRLGNNLHGESDRLSDAFGNLRKRCGVSEQVISLKGSGYLKATVLPLHKLDSVYISKE